MYSPKSKKKKRKKPSPKVEMKKGALKGLFKRRTRMIDEAAGM